MSYLSASDKPTDEEVLYYGLPLSAWLRISLLTLAFGLLFRTSLTRLWWKTNPFTGEANWSHAVCVPLVGLYYLYVHRESLLKAKLKPALEGLPILIAGPLILLMGISVWQNDFLKDLAIPVTLFGLVLFTCGWRVMKIAWFPIAFLVCAFPWPPLLYSRIAMPLQEIAAKVAVEVMTLSGATAEKFGTKIIIHTQSPNPRILNVEEACAGMRSLMTFITLGTAMAFLSVRPLWQKLIIVASAVPIAVFCNVIRVSGQGLLDTYWSHDWSEGFAHQFAGMVMLVPAFFLLVLVGKVLDLAVIEVAEPSVTRTKQAVAQPEVLRRRRSIKAQPGDARS